jgi:hypothetical protein
MQVNMTMSVHCSKSRWNAGMVQSAKQFIKDAASALVAEWASEVAVDTVKHGMSFCEYIFFHVQDATAQQGSNNANFMGRQLIIVRSALLLCSFCVCVCVCVCN